MKHQNFNKLLFIIIPLVTVLLGILLIYSPNKSTSTTITEKAWPIKAIKLEQKKYTPNQLLYGQITSTHQSKMTSGIESDVMKVLVKEGQSVKKNQLLIVLDSKTQQLLANEKKAEMASLNAKKRMEKTIQESNINSLKHDKKLLSLNQNSMKRYEKLNKRNLSAKSDVDNANKLLVQQMLSVQKRKLEIANHANKMLDMDAKIAKVNAQYQQALENIEDSQINAPFDGKITQVNVSIGDLVKKHAPLVSLYDLNEVYVQAQIPHNLQPTLFSALTNHKKILARPVNYPDVKLELDRLGSRVAVDSANINVYFKVPKNYSQLAPLGMTVSIMIDLPKVSAYKIPSTALFGHDKAYLIKNNRLQQITVKRLSSMTEKKSYYLLIKSNEIHSGDTLLITQLPNAISGLKVNVLGITDD